MLEIYSMIQLVNAYEKSFTNENISMQIDIKDDFILSTKQTSISRCFPEFSVQFN